MKCVIKGIECEMTVAELLETVKEMADETKITPQKTSTQIDWAIPNTKKKVKLGNKYRPGKKCKICGGPLLKKKKMFCGYDCARVAAHRKYKREQRKLKNHKNGLAVRIRVKKQHGNVAQTKHRNDLAVEIRKPGETWGSALKRACGMLRERA